MKITVHNCFGPPFLFVEGLLLTGPTLSSVYLRDEVTITAFFNIHAVRTRRVIYKKTQHKDLKFTYLCLGPIQTQLEAFLGFLSKTKMKAYAKLTG